MHETATKKDAWATARIPEWKKDLLAAVQKRRGDRYMSETVEHAVDRLIEKHFPGATEGGS